MGKATKWVPWVPQVGEIRPDVYQVRYRDDFIANDNFNIGGCSGDPITPTDINRYDFLVLEQIPAATTVQDAHMKLHAINLRRFELIDKKSTVGLTAPEHMELERLQYEAGQYADVIAPLPPQVDSHVPATSPLDSPVNDTCLVWLAGKITTAMKEFPEDADAIRQDWLAGKAGLAKSMLGKIEDVRAKRKGGAA